MDSSKKQWHNNVMNTDFLPAGPSSLWSGNRLSQALCHEDKSCLTYQIWYIYNIVCGGLKSTEELISKSMQSQMRSLSVTKNGKTLL